jgi:hypothetical protein
VCRELGCIRAACHVWQCMTCTGESQGSAEALLLLVHKQMQAVMGVQLCTRSACNCQYLTAHRGGCTRASTCSPTNTPASSQTPARSRPGRADATKSSPCVHMCVHVWVCACVCVCRVFVFACVLQTSTILGLKGWGFGIGA